VRGFLPVLLVVGVPAAIYLAYRSWQQEQKRRELLMQWATSSGFSYAVEDDTWCDRWQGTPFGEGDHRRARNVVSGVTGTRPFTVFDYSYQTHSCDGRGNRSTQTHHYVVAGVQLPTYLPRLQVTPENVFTRIGNALGLDDIELESEDFNRRFRVHAADRKFASDVLSPRTMQALLARPELSWRIDGTDIVGWGDGRISPTEVLALTSTLNVVVDGIPSFVWHDHGVGETA
jgi:Protein of unknown function (DUF3137)